MKINVDRWFSIVRSSIDACWVTSVIEWCQEWIVKKKRGKNKINKIIIQLREQIEKLYRWKCTNFLFYSMKKKKTRQREKAFIQFDQSRESYACLQFHSSSSSEIDIVSKTSITMCV